MRPQISENSALVSVIVPVYNVRLYIRKCVCSILNQTYRNIEIILIDDGSSDRSGRICDKLAKRDHRIIVCHKENGGVSSARNEGLGLASGKYVLFADGDDWLPADSIMILVKNAEETQAEMVTGQARRIYLIGEADRYKLIPRVIEREEPEALFDYALSLRSSSGKLFLMDTIRENKLAFSEGVHYGEDREFVWAYMNCCRKYSFISANVYFYSQLRGENACKKYFPDTNRWMLLWMRHARTLGQVPFETSEAFRRGLFLLETRELYETCGYYASRQYLSEEEAIAKIKETCDMKAQYVTDLDRFPENEYLEPVNNCEYGKLYRRFHIEEKRTVKWYVKKIVLKLRQIWVYRILSGSDRR